MRIMSYTSLTKLFLLVVLTLMTINLALPTIDAQNGTWCGEKCVRTDDGIAGCLIGGNPPNFACRLRETTCTDVVCPTQIAGFLP